MKPEPEEGGRQAGTVRPPAADRDACPICGAARFQSLFSATDRLFRTTARRFEVVACCGCGLMRLHPRPTREELERYYPAAYWYTPGGSLAGRLEQTYRRIVLRDHAAFVLRALDAAGGRGPVLDVGCGSGLLLRALKRRGVPVTGLDFSPTAAAIAWRANGVPCACGNPAGPPFRDGAFRVVTMFHVLEHVEDPAGYLTSAGRLLASGGRLVVQVPDAASWLFLLLRERWSGLDVPRHLIDFRASDLEALLGSRGFEVVRRKHFSLRDNPAAFATSLAPWLDPALRPVRGAAESHGTQLLKSALYFCLVVAALPFSALEAACGAGATIMLEARKK